MNRTPPETPPEDEPLRRAMQALRRVDRADAPPFLPTSSRRARPSVMRSVALVGAPLAAAAAFVLFVSRVDERASAPASAAAPTAPPAATIAPTPVVSAPLPSLPLDFLLANAGASLAAVPDFDHDPVPLPRRAP